MPAAPSFKTISLANALLCCSLFVVLLTVPRFVFWIFSVDANQAASFIARRASILFLGLAIISYLARRAPYSELRQAIVFGMFVLWAVMAGLGVYEYLCGSAGLGIFLAVGVEICLAIGNWIVWRKRALSEE